MSRADLSVPPRTRFQVVALVALIHVVLVFGLIRAFAPDFAAQVTDSVLATFNVAVTPPPPPPPPAAQPEKAGAAAPVGRKAVPRESTLPKPKIAIAKPVLAPVPAKGPDNSSGARNVGIGTGAGGQGHGTGSGSGGNGQGGGAATKAVKIAGDINTARDLPSGGREMRLGSFVNVALTVGADGRVKECRIFRASSDAEADHTVCQLAVARFRFRPATDRSGNPVESVFGWQQRYCAGNAECTRTFR